MIIYPAIDLLNNRCVRLYQGNFEKLTEYSCSAVEVAEKYAQQGAKWLHCVDLSAAKNPMQTQKDLIIRLAEMNTLKVQVGGGIRSEEQIEYYLKRGVERVVIGSLAITEPAIVKDWLKRYSADRIVLALDVFCQNDEPMLALNAWQKISKVKLYDLLAFYQTTGIKHVLCTDINADGTLNGPNVGLYRTMLQKYPFLSLQASGGVGQLNQIIQLKELGVAGVILGKSLYENKLSLTQLIALGESSC